MTRQEFITKFIASKELPDGSLVPHLGKTNEEAAGSLMDAALREFSRDVPQRKSVTGAWSGTEITLAGWYDGASVLSIECPTGNRPKTYLTVADYEGDPDTGAIYLLAASTGLGYRIRYNAMHDLPDPKDQDTEAEEDAAAAAVITIEPELHQAFFRLVAAYAFDRLASKHGETTGSAFAADSVSYQTKSGEYTKLAKEARLQYRRLLGLPDAPAPDPVLIHVPYDQPTSRTFPEDTPWPIM
jgi:hypothetical protein